MSIQTDIEVRKLDQRSETSFEFIKRVRDVVRTRLQMADNSSDDIREVLNDLDVALNAHVDNPALLNREAANWVRIV